MKPSILQRAVLTLGALVLCFALLDPPMVFRSASGHESGHVFGTWFSSYEPAPMQYTPTIDTPLLALELLVVLGITALLYVALAPRR